MSIAGDVFDPKAIKAILKPLVKSTAQKKAFDKWNESVRNRVTSWNKNRETQSKHEEQLAWEAEVVEYVDYIHRETSVHGNASANKLAPSLPAAVPLLGPRFCPPSYLHKSRRHHFIEPKTAYIKPITVIHPVFFPGLLNNCPQCSSTDTHWDGWNATGAREVHGIRREERAIGYQLRCKECRVKYGRGGKEEGKGKNSFSTTSPLFWKNWEHWKIPRNIPRFLSRTAVTHELFDMIVELRPSTTSAGLAESIKQLHLLEYKQQELEYLLYFRASPKGGLLQSPELQSFSAPGDKDGYNDTPITDDMVSDVYLDFVNTTRQTESIEYCKTRTAICLSLDNTFKAAKKAVVVDKNRDRTSFLKGGVLSIINEKSEIMSWRFCLSASPAEIKELLDGIVKRCDALKIDLPSMLVADNCCQIRGQVHKAMPLIAILLDVYHFMMRYGAVIINGVKNPHRSEVLKDIRDAILKESSGTDRPAKYWSQAEQEQKLVNAYNKWSLNGGVWSAAAAKVHADQLAHVRKGCLKRDRQDIATDGSRIEGSHKGWNSLQRAHPSGIEMYGALAHDFVLRRNIRIAISDVGKRKKAVKEEFIKSTFGSHHINLVNFSADLFNSLRKADNPHIKSVLPRVDSGEIFGLVESPHTQGFGGLLVIKEESEELGYEFSCRERDISTEELLAEMNIDQKLISMPENEPIATVDRKGKRKADVVEVVEEDVVVKRICLKPAGPSAELTPYDLVVENESSSSTALTSEVKKNFSNVNSFFSFHTSSSQALPVVPAPRPQVQEELPPPPRNVKLTRSQLLFSVGTSINPFSMAIRSDHEFYLFMDMRAEFQWASFSMTSQQWVSATRLYNERLEILSKARSFEFVKKHPRALLEKLSEIEPKVVKRWNAQNFISHRKNTTEFWTKHCKAVPSLVMIKTEAETTASVNSKARKVATCSRCKTIMYPGPTGAPENHKKGYCGDGVAQKPKSAMEPGPEWPQPPGIFITGSHFNPLKFLLTIRELYDKVIDNVGGNLDHAMEEEAFSRMLSSRMTFSGGRALFLLFELENVPETPQSLIVEENGKRYLRVDCLRSDSTSSH